MISEDTWYNEMIEDPLKEIVHLLRNNGVNTECSCGHQGYIQCQYIIGDDIKKVHELLFNYLHSNNLPVDYTINVKISVMNGHQYPSMEIVFPLNMEKL